MNFKNKIFITFFILLAFILFFNINNVFANVTVDDNNAGILLTEVKNYFNNNNLVLYNYVICNNGVVFAFAQEDYMFNILNNAIYVRGAHEFTFSLENDYYTFTLDNSGVQHVSFSSSKIKYSSFDIYNYNGVDLFFPLTPVPLKTLGVEIPALETAEQIPEAIATTLKIIIPVGLIVLSIGLVIYIIRRVIYLTK